ncbi:MAG: orotidine-5'-phosphate decarboxylase [Ruminococcaceae bacterium]|nr:orotidine-5'-phosphate decarboxylase [Oscillospiraceae bacterium]
MSATKLIKLIDEKKNPSVVGLDPMLDYIPEEIINKAVNEYGKTFKAAGEALFEYNKAIIDAVCDIVPCVKPQSAFYELYGTEGEEALKKTIEYAKNAGLYVLLDVKRGDIGSTAAAYSSAYLGKTDVFGEKLCACECDAVTVNPYLGSDGVLPFVKDCEACDRMIFALVKTSNPSSGELQDMFITDESGEKIPVYMHVASLVKKWGQSTISECGYSGVGAVVGATYPEQLKALRAFMPETIFLIPGYGAQGGKAEDIACAFDKEGHGAIVNSSRGIITAHKKVGGDPKTAWRNAALAMKEDLTK